MLSFTSSVSLVFVAIALSTVRSARVGVEQETYGAAASYHSSSAEFALIGGGSTSVDCTSGFLNTVAPLYTSHSSKTPQLPPAPLSIARCGLAAAAVGDTTLFAGGNSKFGYVAAIDRYVNGTLQVQPRLKLSTKRSWVSGTSAGLLAFFVGGFSTKLEAKSAAVDVFDGSKVTVSAMTPLPSGRMFHSATAIESTNGTISLWVGGGSDDNGVTGAVHVMHYTEGNSGGWNVFNLSSKRAKLVSAAVSSKTSNFVVFAGGEGAQGDGEKGWNCTGSFCMSTNVDIFSREGELLQTLALSEPRSRLAAVTLGCRVVFAGGKTLDGFSTAVDVLDVCNSAAPTISAGSALSEARADLAGAAASVGEAQKAFFVGGLGDSGVSSAVDAIP
jgi:hypothetical protein